MKIVDRLRVGEVIKLGPKNGSGFIFCGRVTNQTIPDMERKLEGVKDSKRRYLNTLHRRVKKFSSEKYKKEVGEAAAEKELKSAKHAISLTEKYLNNFIPLRQREYIEEYPSITEAAQIIIMEGGERGDYWGSWEV